MPTTTARVRGGSATTVEVDEVYDSRYSMGQIRAISAAPDRVHGWACQIHLILDSYSINESRLIQASLRALGKI